jgi:uncharacterized protein (DUF4415 family)
MKATKEFPFDKARSITTSEVHAARKAIEKIIGKPRAPRGRPHKTLSEKYLAVSIRLHPKIIAWVKKQAKKRRIGYQTIINEILLEQVA